MTTAAPTPHAAATPRTRLEQQANLVRARLLRRIDALKGRAQRLRNPADELRAHPQALVVAGGAAAIALGGAVTFAAYRFSTRKERALRLRIEGWARLLRHPERVAPQPLHSKLFERAVGAAITTIIASVGRHYLEELMAPRHVDIEQRWQRRALPPAPDPFPSPRVPRP